MTIQNSLEEQKQQSEFIVQTMENLHRLFSSTDGWEDLKDAISSLFHFFSLLILSIHFFLSFCLPFFFWLLSYSYPQTGSYYREIKITTRSAELRSSWITKCVFILWLISHGWCKFPDNMSPTTLSHFIFYFFLPIFLSYTYQVKKLI